MNILFEEDGAFKAGVVLADNTASLQVELPSGKRGKVKAANVLLRFDAPPPAELIERAEAQAAEIDTDFLWEVCPEAEFAFEELAAEYVGTKPGPVEAAAVLLRLHSAPIYFHRKGKGRFRKAPPEILQAALAGLEKKRQQALAIERMANELKAGTLPAEFPPHAARTALQARPQQARDQGARSRLRRDRPVGAAPAGKVRRPCRYPRVPPRPLPLRIFPQGHGLRRLRARRIEPQDPAAAAVRAFSIDDAHTTEIDDAFSLEPLADGGMRVGIHIAAPGLGIAPDSDLGRIARDRLSTVYMPGRKITMLPEDVVERFTLAEGHTCRRSRSTSMSPPTCASWPRKRNSSACRWWPTCATTTSSRCSTRRPWPRRLPDFPFRDELTRLWELATVLEAGRGASGKQNRKDYNFVVDWSAATPQGSGRIAIDERQRGTPLDKLVAELMIVANSTWGALLRDAKVAAIYRAQTNGKMRMTTVAAPHEGLGVDCYAWSSSPLRRHVDLINQWQLIAHLRGETPPFTAKSADFLAALRDFEFTYAAYADFQRDMERYWCLRWLLQEDIRAVEAAFVKESLARLERIPLFVQDHVPARTAPRHAGAPGRRRHRPAGRRDHRALPRIAGIAGTGRP